MSHVNYRGMVYTILCLLFSSPALIAGNEVEDPFTRENFGAAKDNHKGRMLFEKNHGQIKNTKGEPESDVLYYASTPKFSWYLTRSGIKYVFSKNTENESNYFRVDLNYIGADFSRIEEVSTAGTASYYDGELALSAKLMYQTLLAKDFYPNIDLELKATKKGFKYNYIVHPGGKVSDIKMKYSDHAHSGILKSGDFNLITELGEINESAPFSFQLKGNDQAEVHSAFIYENDLLTFDLDDYDTTQILIIDPLIEVQTYFGGDEEDEAFAIANNDDYQASNFEVYITGYTTSGAYPAVGSSTVNTYGSTKDKDVFVACFDHDLSTLNWVTYMRGDDTEVGRDITFFNGAPGELFVTGETSSPNFPVSGAVQSTHGGQSDAFLFKLNASNGTRQFCTYIGDGDDEYGTAVSIGSVGIRVAGYSNSSTLTSHLGAQPSYSVPSTTNSGGFDAFVTEYGNVSGTWHWGTFLGGPKDDFAYDIIEGPGVTAQFWVAGAMDNSTDLDVMLWDLDDFTSAQGLALTGSYTYGGSGDQIAYEGKSMEVHSSLCLVGSTTSNSLGTGTYHNYNSGMDGFLINIDLNSYGLNDVNYTGGSGDDLLTHMSTYNNFSNDLEKVVAVGFTDDKMDIAQGDWTCSSNTGFHWVCDVDGDDSWATYLNCETKPYGVVSPRDLFGSECGEVYITGTTWNTDLTETSSSFQSLLDQNTGGTGGTGKLDAFISRVNILIGPIEFDYDVFCRRTELKLQKADGSAYVASRSKTQLTAYPSNGFFYGAGSYYDESTGLYYFHADSGDISNSTTTITYRVAWDGDCILETTHDFGIVAAHGNPLYPVICTTGTPAVNQAEFEIVDSYPAGISASYEWVNSALNSICTTAYCSTLVHDTYHPKIIYTGTGIVDGCKYDGSATTKWGVLVNDDATRIEMDLQHAYDYYDDGNVVLTLHQGRSSWYRYFHYPSSYPFNTGGSATDYNGPKWYKGIYSGTSAYQNEGLTYASSTQGSYYVKARNRCDATASDIMTDHDEHATVNNNAHCRTDQHEKVLDSNTPSFPRGQVKENDASDYFSGTATKYFIEGRLDFLPGVLLDLSGAELTLAPNAQLHIYPGATVDFSNCQITTCDANDPWSYIKVYGTRGLRHLDGQFNFGGTTGTPVIERARAAVRGTKGGRIDIQNTTFNDNLLSIHVFESEEDGDIEIHNNTFNAARSYAQASWHPCSVDAYIAAKGAEHMNITGNTIVGTSSNENFFGIYIKDGDENSVQANVFENGYLDYAMYFDEAGNYTVSGNQICDNKTSLGSCNINRGIYMKYIDDLAGTSVVDDNIFRYLECGMEYYHSDPPSGSYSTVEGNEFVGNTYGLMVFSEKDAAYLYACPGSPLTNAATTNDINLKLNCNDFLSNDVAIIGGGKLPSQGIPTVGHGNDWGSGATANHHYDFMWNNGGTAITWHSYLSNDPNANAVITNPDYCLNGSTITYSSTDLGVGVASGQNLCGSFPPPTTAIEESAEKGKINIYPNPFANELFIQTRGDVGNNLNVTMYDLQGRVIYSDPNAKAGTLTIPTNGVGIGAYILQVIPENGHPETFKIIKQ